VPAQCIPFIAEQYSMAWSDDSVCKDLPTDRELGWC
jgi:hypothetical protein